MNHQRAQELLPDYADGALSRAAAERVGEHLKECARCREWLEAFRELAAGLLPEDAEQAGAGVDHPESGVLARYALAEDELSDREHLSVRHHLLECPGCLAELELVEAAVLAARTDEETDAVLARRRVRWSLPLAASLIAAVVGAALFFALRLPHLEQDARISGRAFEGAQVVEAARTVTVDSARLETGSRLTLRASDAVILGEGFVVGDQADLTIEITGGL